MVVHLTLTLVDYVGNGATFNITNDGTNYGVVVTANGTDYHVGQTFVVAGNLIEDPSQTIAVTYY